MMIFIFKNQSDRYRNLEKLIICLKFTNIWGRDMILVSNSRFVEPKYHMRLIPVVLMVSAIFNSKMASIETVKVIIVTVTEQLFSPRDMMLVYKNMFWGHGIT